MDGARALRATLAELGLGEADARKHLEEALEYRVLALVAATG